MFSVLLFFRTFPTRRIYIGVCAITSSHPLQLSVNLQCVSLHQTLVFNRKSFILVVGSTCQSGLQQPTFARPKWIYKKATRSTIFETIRWPQVSRLWRFLPPSNSCGILVLFLFPSYIGWWEIYSGFPSLGREKRGEIFQSESVAKHTQLPIHSAGGLPSTCTCVLTGLSFFFLLFLFRKVFFPFCLCVCGWYHTKTTAKRSTSLLFSFSMNQFFIFSIAPPIIWLVKRWINNEHRHCL